MGIQKSRIDELSILIDFVQQDFSKLQQERDVDEALFKGAMLFVTGLSSLSEMLDTQAAPSKDVIWQDLQLVSKDALTLLDCIIRITELDGYMSYDRQMFLLCGHDKNDSYEQPLASQEGWGHTDRVTVGAYWGDESSEEYDEIKVRRCTLRICDLLEGMPLDRLKRCLDCEKIFLQQTAREKKYCSDLCKNRYNLKSKEAKG